MQDLDLLNDHLIVVVCFISYKKWVQKTKTYKYNVPQDLPTLEGLLRYTPLENLDLHRTLLNIQLSFCVGPLNEMLKKLRKETRIQTKLPTSHYYIQRVHVIE